MYLTGALALQSQGKNAKLNLRNIYSMQTCYWTSHTCVSLCVLTVLFSLTKLENVSWKTSSNFQFVLTWSQTVASRHRNQIVWDVQILCMKRTNLTFTWEMLNMLYICNTLVSGRYWLEREGLRTCSRKSVWTIFFSFWKLCLVLSPSDRSLDFENLMDFGKENTNNPDLKLVDL